MVKSLRHLLLIVKYISALVFMLSCVYHNSLSLEDNALSAMEEYFIGFFMEAPSKKPFVTSYHSYRYFSIGVLDKSIVWGKVLVHRMLEGTSFWIEKLPSDPSAPGDSFCNIRNFPEVIKAANVRVISDNCYSMIILSISAFFFGVYIALLAAMSLLGKRVVKATSIQKVLGRLISVVMLLITIFGVYSLNKAKMSMDSYLVCVWEVAKVSAMCLMGFYVDIFAKTR